MKDHDDPEEDQTGIPSTVPPPGNPDIPPPDDDDGGN